MVVKTMRVNTIVLAFRELNNAIKGKARKLVIGTVALIPLLYGSLYLWAFTNPYKTLDTVPVAVVVEDNGAIINGKMRNVGNEIKNRLKNQKDGSEGFQWNFVNSAKANKGLKNGDYFMVATIPASFSKCIASAQYDTPTKAKLHVKYDQASNMLASQIGKTAFRTIRSEISEAIAQEYWEHMFAKVNSASDSLGAAANGAGALHEGSKSLQGGINKLADGSNKLSASLRKLQGGLGELQKGANTLTEANARSKEGAQYLAQKTQDLANGAQQLSEGTQRLSAATDEFYEGAQKLAASSNELEEHVKAGNAETKTKLAGLLMQAQNPAVTKEDVLANLQSLAEGLGENSNFLETNLSALSAGADKLSDGSLQIKGGADAISQGFEAVNTGSNKLAAGANSLAEGLAQVSNGSEKLNNGVNAAAQGSAKIVNGSDQLNSGAKKLSDNTPKLVEGAKKLHDGLKDAQKSGKINNIKQKSKMMSAPVALKEHDYSHVENYGTGFAPYFISIGLWVGALMATFVLRVMDRRAILNGMNPLKSALISFTPFVIMGVVQAVILMGVVHGALKLQIDNVGAFYALGIIASIVFMAIMQMIMVVFKIPGRIVAIVLLMLQITSSAGTFPVQMTPSFFRAVHPYLPMTYSILGLRQAMAGRNSGAIASSIGILVIFGIIAIAITSIVDCVKRTVTMFDLHPVITLEA
ncbi:YhgE/Pip domain-containing protein [Gardnerella vaginalis ATCC 14018 = JCM 11026]|uniref:YhgE/Pip domain protein n=2 Tax=Gardnerella vaginalis TaxID=2702 RepID=E3DAJ9_GARV3|nr:YhgE/Pip domain protein [Gardnerella vaginalis ATCC 14019]TCH81114.1 YhgE/Pip domain-containing protein [Gardnerella vaginalis]TCH82357.1 YhgE/Pip domain-containing protein [Gardnerella vaginalis ATCC 14018 = JCM 11026]